MSTRISEATRLRNHTTPAAVQTAAHLSAVGAAASYSVLLHSLISAHTRGRVAVGGDTSYSSAVHSTFLAAHTRSDEAVGASASSCVAGSHTV